MAIHLVGSLILLYDSLNSLELLSSNIKTRCPRLKINVRKQIFQRLVFVLFLCDNLPDILYSQVSQKWREGGGDRKNHALHNYYLTSLCVPSALHYSRGFLTMVVVSHTLTLKTSPFCTFLLCYRPSQRQALKCGSC